MKLSQINLFLAICETGTITAAADYLHISQPSATVSLKNLEDEFNVQLFYRVKKRLVLTKEGLIFKEAAEKLSEEALNVSKLMADTKLGIHRLRIGIPAMTSILLYSKVISPFCRENPDIYVELTEKMTPFLLEDLAAGKLDFVITPTPKEKLSSNHVFLPLHENIMVVCVQKDHPLAGKKEIGLANLIDYPLVLNGEGSMTSKAIMRHFDSLGIRPRILLNSSQILLCIQAIRSNQAVGFFMKEIIDMYDDLVPIDLKPAFSYYIGLNYLEEPKPRSAEIKFLRSIKHSFSIE